MFTSWVKHAKTGFGFSSIADVSNSDTYMTDNQESFTFAETFKSVLSSWLSSLAGLASFERDWLADDRARFFLGQVLLPAVLRTDRDVAGRLRP
jgi:hypothetical protein